MCLQICDTGNSSVIIINGDTDSLHKWGIHRHSHVCLKRQDMGISFPQLYKVAEILTKGLTF